MIRRARRDGREARRNEEGGRERIEKGSTERIIEKRERDKTGEGGPERTPFYRIFWILQVGAQASNFVFYKNSKMSWCETECKNMCRW